MRLILYLILCIALIVLESIPFVKDFFGRSIFLKMPYLFILSSLTSFLLMPLIIKLAWKLKLIDGLTEERKIHKAPTPTTGGIAIVLGFVITLFVNFHFSFQMKIILTSSVLLFITGLIDDLRGLPAIVRLGIQILITSVMIASGIRITFIPDYLGGFYLESIITVIWILGITNAMNFIDGLDGLAGGVSAIAALFFSFCAYLTNQHSMVYLSIAIAGACIGFLPYNFRRNKNALVFMGDSGSTFLGFTLASVALLGDWGNSIIDLAAPVLILSVLIFDMVLTTAVRIKRGDVRTFNEWLSFTGRDHFHHRLLSVGLSKANATLAIHCTSICFGLASIAVLYTNWAISLVVIAHAILAFGILGLILVFGSEHKNTKVT